MHTTAALEAANLADATTITRRIRALADRYDNADTDTESLMVENYLADRPAYWSKARGGSNADAGIFLRLLGELGFVNSVIEEARRCYPHSPRDWARVELLDDLLPLTWRSAFRLQEAYRAAGTFRSIEELVHRTERAEGRTVDEVARKAVEHHVPGAALVEA